MKKHIEQLENKRIAVFCVGASPFDEQAFKQVYEHNFSGNLSNISCFYGRGAWNEEKMSFADRTMCKMLQKNCYEKRPRNICTVGKSVDVCGRAKLRLDR